MNFVEHFSFDPRLQIEIEKAGLVKPQQVILLSDSELRNRGNFFEEDIRRIKEICAQQILPRGFISVETAEKELAGKWLKISLDCPVLDSLLGGGVPMSGVTELSGESGAGKTQLCLQLSITVQYPPGEGGAGKATAYLCTEDCFPSRRLQQMLLHFPRRSGPKAEPNLNFGDNIFVDHIADVESMIDCLNVRLPRLIRSRRVGLVVIDSIAAIFRGDYDIKESVVRAKHLREIGRNLHDINRKYSVAILCVNQVSDVVGSNESIPSLGLAWANLVTTRLQAFIVPDGRRKLEVTSSPSLPSRFVYYSITEGGVHGILPDS